VAGMRILVANAKNQLARFFSILYGFILLLKDHMECPCISSRFIMSLLIMDISTGLSGRLKALHFP
jgi:hypothetical protein